MSSENSIGKVTSVLRENHFNYLCKKYGLFDLCIFHHHPSMRIVFGCMFTGFIWMFDFSPLHGSYISILNDLTIMTISKDRVKTSPLPDSWKLIEMFAICVF